MDDIPFHLAIEAARLIFIAIAVAGVLLVVEHHYDTSRPRRRK
jgi:hypothetical protein